VSAHKLDFGEEATYTREEHVGEGMGANISKYVPFRLSFFTNYTNSGLVDEPNGF
jgi:hypothetical protein